MLYINIDISDLAKGHLAEAKNAAAKNAEAKAKVVEFLNQRHARL
jgi:hypothetical protein